MTVMDDVKFIQIAAAPLECGATALFALDSAGAIWRLMNEHARATDDNSHWPATIVPVTWVPLPVHPARSDKRDS